MLTSVMFLISIITCNIFASISNGYFMMYYMLCIIISCVGFVKYCIWFVIVVTKAIQLPHRCCNWLVFLYFHHFMNNQHVWMVNIVQVTKMYKKASINSAWFKLYFLSSQFTLDKKELLLTLNIPVLIWFQLLWMMTLQTSSIYWTVLTPLWVIIPVWTGLYCSYFLHCFISK